MPLPDHSPWPGLKLAIQLMLPNDQMAAAAELADEVGFESLWVPEHLIWPVSFEATYPYSESGRPPVPDAFPIHDSWVLLAFLAARTRSIRLGTSVFILPLRDPHVTARAVATLDLFSGGRAMLGAGVGWMREEFEIAGQNFGNRGRRTDEIITILRELWSGPEVSFEGEHYSFPAVHFEPKPPQGGSLPIHIGGESPAALRRAARLGDGWIGFPRAPDEAAEKAGELKQLRQQCRRDGAFEVTVGGPASLDFDMAMKYRKAGVDRVSIRPWRAGEDPRAGIERMAPIVERLRREG